MSSDGSGFLSRFRIQDDPDFFNPESRLFWSQLVDFLNKLKILNPNPEIDPDASISIPIPVPKIPILEQTNCFLGFCCCCLSPAGDCCRPFVWRGCAETPPPLPDGHEPEEQLRTSLLQSPPAADEEEAEAEEEEK